MHLIIINQSDWLILLLFVFFVLSVYLHFCIFIAFVPVLVLWCFVYLCDLHVICFSWWSHLRLNVSSVYSRSVHISQA